MIYRAIVYFPGPQTCWLRAKNAPVVRDGDLEVPLLTGAAPPSKHEILRERSFRWLPWARFWCRAHLKVFQNVRVEIHA